MSQSEDILKSLRSVRQELIETFHVRRMALFGSYSRNEALPGSDIDLLVEFDVSLQEYIRNKEELRAYLKGLFKKEIDIANPLSLKSAYRDDILNQAIDV